MFPFLRAGIVLRTFVVVLVLTSFLIACETSTETDSAVQPHEIAQELAALSQVWDILTTEYINKNSLDLKILNQAALDGLLKALDNPEITSLPSPLQEFGIPKNFPAELNPIWDGWVGISQEFGPTILGNPTLAQETIKGLLNALDDEHIAYIDPERYQIERQSIEGNYEGIGAEIYLRGGRLIINPMPESPAARAGLRAGDTILEVDGESTDGWTIVEAVSRIRGENGSTVELLVLHLGADQSELVEVVRGVIEVESVFWNMTNDHIAYLRISSFYGNTDRAVIEALLQVQQEGARGIVIDLRSNPGGYMNTVVNITSQFLEHGLVVYELDGRGNRTNWNVRRGGVATEIPVVILVNEYSASGSEVLAGALQDHNRAKVIGTTTFGKGSVNLFKGLVDGGGLYFTYALWYTPNGTLIEKDGLKPDIEVATSVGRHGDQQLDEALIVLREQIELAP